jgi:TonB family protein
MKLTINELGKVTAAKVVRGVQDELDAAAKAAALQFKFKPGRSGGNPVITTGFVYRYTWVIED